jgi:hypothetical protein
MPYAYQLDNRRRLKRTIVTCSVLLVLFLVIFVAPTKMQGWSGLGWGWGTLTGSDETLVELPPAVEAVAAARMPRGDYLSWPTESEFGEFADAPAEPAGWPWAYDSELSMPTSSWAEPVEEPAGTNGNALGPLVGGRSTGQGQRRLARGASSAGGGFGGAGGGGGGGLRANDANDLEGAEGAASETPGLEAVVSDAGSASAAARTISELPRGSGSSPGSGGSSSGSGGSSPGSAASTPAAASPVETSPVQSASTGSQPGPDNLLLSPVAPGSPDAPSGSPVAGSESNTPNAFLPKEIVKAIVDGPTGTETIYGEGDPGRVSEAAGLSTPASNGADSGDQANVEVVPEPVVLSLFAAGLFAAARQKRRPALRRP